jgi:exopolyphosphatase/guanosine-5'-triphosphate,3'-diphosphate pyrophosphatase
MLPVIKKKSSSFYAAVDLGSNSFHMIVADAEGNELKVIDRLRSMVRLASGLTKD